MLFAGSTRSHQLVDRILALGWGRLFVEHPKPRDGEPWALDNGVFSAWKSGKAWEPKVFLRSLEQAISFHAPTFGVLPDIVGGGVESIAHSMRWRERLPDLRWYLAVQDGMTVDAVRAVLPEVAGLFLGGTDAFKATAPAWCELAHSHGKSFHYARVSTANRLRAALECGADSADSSQMLWSTKGAGNHFDRFVRWWNDLNAQVPMFAASPNACDAPEGKP